MGVHMDFLTEHKAETASSTPNAKYRFGSQLNPNIHHSSEIQSIKIIAQVHTAYGAR